MDSAIWNPHLHLGPKCQDSEFAITKEALATVIDKPWTLRGPSVYTSSGLTYVKSRQSAAVGGGGGFYFIWPTRQPGFLYLLFPGKEMEQVAGELFWAMPGRGAHYFIHFLLTTKSHSSASMQRRLRNINPGWAAASHRQRCPAEEKQE